MGEDVREHRWIARIPNLLTGLRMALAGVLPFVGEEYRASAVAVAGASDGFDGWLARRFHATSHLGRLLDGIADKAFVLSAVATLAATGHMPWWEGVAVMSRDVVVAAIAAWCAARGRWEAFRHMRPRALGKATTVAAFLWFLTLLIPGASAFRLPTFLLAAASSACAAVDYAVAFSRWRPEPAGGDAHQAG